MGCLKTRPFFQLLLLLFLLRTVAFRNQFERKDLANTPEESHLAAMDTVIGLNLFDISRKLFYFYSV